MRQTAVAIVTMTAAGVPVPGVIAYLLSPELPGGFLFAITNLDGYAVWNSVPVPFSGVLQLAGNSQWYGSPTGQAVSIPNRTDITLRCGPSPSNPQDVQLPAVVPFKKGSVLPAPPTRDQLCRVNMSFQGLEFDTLSYGHVWWWETIAWWPAPADRKAAYAAKRAAGDTHIILDLSGAYKEGIPGAYNDTGADYSHNLPALVALAEEAIQEGFWIDLRLAGDGQGAGPYYNDPVGLTYGHDWLMNNFPRIASAFAHLVKYIVFVPGYDGIFYSWTPEQVMAFGSLFRSIFPTGTLGIEFNTGHIPLGEGGGDYLPGGRMQDYDVIYGEFDPFNYHQDSTWQIVGRLVSPYNRPPDQPAGDDPNPPFYLGTPNVRGPWYFIAFEILTYTWVRGQNSQADIAAYRQYFSAMGCEHIC